jgi:hypothetical protein
MQKSKSPDFYKEQSPRDLGTEPDTGIPEVKNLFIIFVYILALVCGIGYEITRDRNLQ